MSYQASPHGAAPFVSAENPFATLCPISGSLSAMPTSLKDRALAVCVREGIILSIFLEQKRGRRGAIALLSVCRSALSVVALVLAANCPATAQVDPPIPPDMVERIAFVAADSNGDGYISEAELARDAAVGFSSLDKNHDGKLTPQELGPHDPALFKRVDRNGDGVLTFSEVMANKLQGLEAGDKNHDGRLSFDEMVEEVKVEEGVR